MSLAAQWEVHDLAAVHVVPRSDGILHEFDMDCVCGPAVEFHDRPLVIHHSLDGREAREGKP